MEAGTHRINLLVMAPVLGADLSYLQGIDPSIDVVDGNALHLADGAQVAERDRLLADADALIVGFPVPAILAASAPHLRYAHHTQAGASNLLASDLWRSTARLTSSRGTVNTTAIAEYAIAGIYHFARGLHEAMRQQRDGEFTKSGYSMRTLSGSTVGVVGLGGIGMEVARLGRAAGMRVVATRRSITEPQHDVDGADLLLPADRLRELAAQSDFVVVCSQLTEETREFIDEAVFAAMPAHAVLINVARGEQVDEDALVAALRSRSIGGAVLDVYHGDLEFVPPRPDLLALPNVVITPHLSGMGASFAEAGRRLARENVRRFVAGEPLINEIDRARGY